MRALMQAGGPQSVPHLNLVALDCRPVDITRIVNRGGAAVYPPAVLRLRGQSLICGGLAKAGAPERRSVSEGSACQRRTRSGAVPWNDSLFGVTAALRSGEDALASHPSGRDPERERLLAGAGAGRVRRVQLG